MNKKKPKYLEKIVSQDSELGSYALCAMVANGICGPPYGLSDLSVYVSRTITEHEEYYNVSFYDMSCKVNKKNKYYKDIKDNFSEVLKNE